MLYIVLLSFLLFAFSNTLGQDCDLQTVLPSVPQLKPEDVDLFTHSDDSKIKIVYVHTKSNEHCKEFVQEIDILSNIIENPSKYHKTHVPTRLAVVDADQYPKILDIIGLVHLPAILYATEGHPQLKEYIGVFHGEQIFDTITRAYTNNYAIVDTVEDWERLTLKNEIIVAVLINETREEDFGFLSNFQLFFEDHDFQVVISDKKAVRKYFEDVGFIPPATINVIAVWRKHVTIPEGEYLEFIPYERFGELNVDEMFEGYSKLSTFLNQVAHPPADYFSERHHQHLMERGIPLLYVMSNFLLEKNSPSLFDQLTRAIGANATHLGKIQLVYVESSIYGTIFGRHAVNVPSVHIEDVYQLNFVFSGNVNSVDEILSFVDDFYEGRVKPVFLSEDSKIYDEMNKETPQVKYLVGDNVLDFIRSSGAHAFLFGYHSQSETTGQTIKTIIDIAKELSKSGAHFGFLNIDLNQFPYRPIHDHLYENNFRENVLLHFENGAYHLSKEYSGSWDRPQDIKKWITSFVSHKTDL